MVSPNFLGLPIFSNFYFILKLSLIGKVSFGCRHSEVIAIRVVEDVLTL
jgi:hypothetical protein